MYESRELKSHKYEAIRDQYREAADFYLDNKPTITMEHLSMLLPKLKCTIGRYTSLPQFNSHFLFLKLCFLYQDKLPEKFAQFKDPRILKKAFLDFQKVNLFNKQTTPEDKKFILRSIRKLTEKISPVDLREEQSGSLSTKGSLSSQESVLAETPQSLYHRQKRSRSTDTRKGDDLESDQSHANKQARRTLPSSCK